MGSLTVTHPKDVDVTPPVTYSDEWQLCAKLKAIAPSTSWQSATRHLSSHTAQPRSWQLPGAHLAHLSSHVELIGKSRQSHDPTHGSDPEQQNFTHAHTGTKMTLTPIARIRATRMITVPRQDHVVVTLLQGNDVTVHCNHEHEITQWLTQSELAHLESSRMHSVEKRRIQKS